MSTYESQWENPTFEKKKNQAMTTFLLLKNIKSPSTHKITHNTHFDPFSDPNPTRQKQPQKHPEFDTENKGEIKGDLEQRNWSRK